MLEKGLYSALYILQWCGSVSAWCGSGSLIGHVKIWIRIPEKFQICLNFFYYRNYNAPKITYTLLIYVRKKKCTFYFQKYDILFNFCRFLREFPMFSSDFWQNPDPAGQTDPDPYNWYFTHKLLRKGSS